MAFFKTRRADGSTSLINLDHIAVMVRTERACLVQLKCRREVHVTPEEFEAIERSLVVVNRKSDDMVRPLREAMNVWKTYLVDPSEVIKFQVVNDWGSLEKGSPPWKIADETATHVVKDSEKVRTEAAPSEGTTGRWFFGPCAKCGSLATLMLVKAHLTPTSLPMEAGLCGSCRGEVLGKVDGP